MELCFILFLWWVLLFAFSFAPLIDVLDSQGKWPKPPQIKYKIKRVGIVLLLFPLAPVWFIALVGAIFFAFAALFYKEITK